MTRPPQHLSVHPSAPATVTPCSCRGQAQRPGTEPRQCHLQAPGVPRWCLPVTITVNRGLCDDYSASPLEGPQKAVTELPAPPWAPRPSTVPGTQGLLTKCQDVFSTAQDGRTGRGGAWEGGRLPTSQVQGEVGSGGQG